MPEEEVMKSPEQIQKEQHEADEKRRAAQADFDPKLHGYGTRPIVEPQSTKELFKHVQSVFDKFEQKMTAMSDYYSARIRELEDKVVALSSK